MQLSCLSLEDAEEIVWVLGNRTSSAHSNLLHNDKCNDDENDGILILDVDEDLMKEMDDLFSDLKL
jgi:hypothetical protein